MSRNQQDAAARKRHREEKRAGQIAKIQQERDTLDISTVLPWFANLRDGYMGGQIIRVDMASLKTQPAIRKQRTVEDLSEEEFRIPGMALYRIYGDYADDIAPPFKMFYIWLTDADETVRIISVWDSDSSQGGRILTAHIADIEDNIHTMIHYGTTEDGSSKFEYILTSAFANMEYEQVREQFSTEEKLSNIVVRTLSLLNLSNIELADKPVSPHLSEACERVFNRSTIYKVLKVNTSHKQYRGAQQETGLQDFDPRRMHVVRGHHAEYGTNGRGLHFGKYERKIWIPAHVRGIEELGIVVKDYEVVNKPDFVIEDDPVRKAEFWNRGIMTVSSNRENHAT